MNDIFNKLVNPVVVENVDKYSREFQSADPFPNLSIDNFFQQQFLRQLIAEFPDMGEEQDLAEGSKKPAKKVPNRAIPDVSKFPPAYVQLDQLMSDPNFLDMISSVTGVPGLVYDPKYLGGGIKISYNGAQLPRHIDFNYHQADRTLLRCLNILFYFNDNWKEEWGGNIQVHRVPSSAGDNSLSKSYAPISGRMFMFETSKISYHAFDPISAPMDVGRRSFGVYFYRKVSELEMDAPTRNTTMYIEEGLPENIVEGHTLNREDINNLKFIINRRDGRIENLYSRLNKRETDIQKYINRIKRLRQENDK